MPPTRRLVEASVKPIEPGEIDVLARWIAAGAPEVDVEPDVATTKPDPLVTDKDRDFWAFRPPQPVAVPTVRDAGRVRNPIDAFVLAKARSEGLTSSRRRPTGSTLLRRASFDLTGLPPEPAEVEAFLADTIARRLRAADRPAARLAALRRTLGPLLARPGRLCRLRGEARAGPAASLRLALPRLRHPGVQRRQAVRPLPARATRRRRTGRLRARQGDHAGDVRQPRRDRLPAHGARTRPGRTSPATSPIASR